MRDNTQSNSKADYLNSLIKQTTDSKFLKIAEKARNDSIEIGKVSISLSYYEANCLHQIIKQHKCLNFIEIGSLTGFSGLFILNALRHSGNLFCFEKESKWISALKENLNQALKLDQNISKNVMVIEGDAQENIKRFHFQHEIDGVFIDANKSAYMEYFELADKLLKPGGIIVADNVYLDGSVWGQPSERFSKKQIEVMRRFNEALFVSGRYESLLLDTSDGMIVAIKK